MQEPVQVTGIIIKAEPMGEFDRRVVILTSEMGKISAFAKYSRKPGNKLMAPTNPFSFGHFKLYAGRNSYTLTEVEIVNYFEPLRTDFMAAYYGMYLLEICDFYTRENNDEKEMLKLLYQSLRALSSKKFPNRLVRYIFELKSIMINGEFPGIEMATGYCESTLYTIDYVMRMPVEKLFSFSVNDEVLCELREFSEQLCSKTFDRDFKSLEILENIE